MTLNPVASVAAIGLIVVVPGLAVSWRLFPPCRIGPIARLPLGFALGVVILGLVSTGAHALGLLLRPFTFAYVGSAALVVGLWAVIQLWKFSRSGRPARSLLQGVPMPGRPTIAVLFLAGLVFVVLAFIGNNNGVGFDEWAHVSSQHELVETDSIFSGAAFDPLVRERDGAVLTTSHDIYDLWFAMASLVTGVNVAQVLFSSAALFAMLEILAFYFMSRSLFRDDAMAAGAVFFFATLYLSGVRAANTRNSARVLVFVGLALIFRWIWQHERKRELFVGSCIFLGAVFVHAFYLNVWATVITAIAVVLLMTRLRRTTIVLASYSLLAVVVLSPYVAPKLVALAGHVAPGTSSPTDEAILEPIGTPIASSAGEISLETRERGGHDWIHFSDGVFVLSPRDLLRSPLQPLTQVISLAILVVLLIRRGRSRSELALIALLSIPALIAFNPVATPLITRVASPDRITRLFVEYLAVPIAVSWALTDLSRRIRSGWLDGNVRGLPIAVASVLVVGLLPHAVSSLAYPVRIHRFNSAADSYIADLRDLMDRAPEAGIAAGSRFVSKPTVGLWLELLTEYESVYPAPRDEVTEAGWGRSYDPRQAGEDAQRILDPSVPANTTVELLRRNRSTNVLVGPGPIRGLAFQGSNLFDLIAGNGSYSVYALNSDAIRRQAMDYLRQSQDAFDTSDLVMSAVLLEEALKLQPEHRGVREHADTLAETLSRHARRTSSLNAAEDPMEEYLMLREVHGALHYLEETRVDARVLGSIRDLREQLLRMGLVSIAEVQPADVKFSEPPTGGEGPRVRGVLTNEENTVDENRLLDWPYLDSADIEFEFERREWVRHVAVQSNSPFNNYVMRDLELLASVDCVHYRTIDRPGDATDPRNGLAVGSGPHQFKLVAEVPAKCVIVRMYGGVARGHTTVGEIDVFAEKAVPG